ncbi:MAG TPA: TlpA disulfide reductase family protein [Candidatus Kapabacteria bacterium]|nr:TlpA disulfide reductase family protein [Candidatus Kapabacteria bacterium]
MKSKGLIGIASLSIAIIVSIYFFNMNANADTSQKDNIYTISNVQNGTKNSIPNFEFNKDGKKTNFKDFVKGKVVFINFWGTWCPPCRREIPDIVEISNELSKKNFVVIGMASEKVADPVSHVAKFAEANKITYTNFIITKELAEAFGKIEAVPTTFIVDTKGNIVEKIVGMRDKETFMASINRVLK